jgi:hypothetical protein
VREPAGRPAGTSAATFTVRDADRDSAGTLKRFTRRLFPDDRTVRVAEERPAARTRLAFCTTNDPERLPFEALTAPFDTMRSGRGTRAASLGSGIATAAEATAAPRTLATAIAQHLPLNPHIVMPPLWF